MPQSLIARYAPPTDLYAGSWVGRAWLPGAEGGPAVVALRPDGIFDITRSAPTVSALADQPDPAAFLRAAPLGVRLGSIEELLANSDEGGRDETKPWLLAPIDLQAIKAAGVTFAASLLERVVEEQTKGDPAAADAVRRALTAEIGTDLARVKPGSKEAETLRDALMARGMWSQYLEVGIGPDPEIFTKAQPLSAVGFGAMIGIHPKSVWNNPEPEIVLVISSAGKIVGVTLGNDVNLRDFEGRSALLLSKAKDNNGSAAIGPFLRLFDDSFKLDDVRGAAVSLHVEGEDGFVMDGISSLAQISRDPTELVAASIGPNHQYPDGLVLFLGTMFAPTKDRGDAGGGFTHKRGDIVTIGSPKLGTLVNRVGFSDQIPPWRFGLRALMANLATRGLLDEKGS
ncbi:MAG TPA: fumarylacetoacetate hydrolase family protein [Aliidongia sp.]|nr:fumarylacetoacetate hydrolase family protein [Aliidongia sp.]